MALNNDTARKIIDVIAADTDCQNVIQPYPNLDLLFTGPALLLEFTHTAGSVRNISLVLKSIVQNKKPEDDAEMTKLLCIGIVAATVKPLIAAGKEGRVS